MTQDRPAHQAGVVTKLSPRPVADTAARLTSMISAKGMKLFAVIDQAAEARQAGLELRAERQAEGIAARRRQAEGRMLPGKKHIGRLKVTGPAEITTLRRLVDDGTSVTQAARTLKISRSTAYAALASTR